MKKKTLFQQYTRTETIYAAMTLLFLMLTLGSIWKDQLLSAKILTTLNLLLACLFFIYRNSYLQKKAKEYEQLCQNFNDGVIFQEFLQKIPGLFPKLGISVSRMDSLINRQNIMQQSTRQAEFLALQNQINPHFLYNTLDSIRGDALVAGATNIADITEALSTFFRYTITNTQNLVTIQDEIENASDYFLIQQYRFGPKISMQVELDDRQQDLLHLSCPKLLLQPIIENAIFHGIEKISSEGKILIRIEQIDNYLNIEISDNGVGIPEAELEALNKSLNHISIAVVNEKKKGGIALKNVCRRIKLLFGEEYGITVHSIVGVGTKVCISLPAIEKSPQQKEAQSL